MNRIILSFVVSVFSVTSLLSFASAATPVASYSFDEGQGTTLTDRSGNGNTGSLVNSLVWGTGKYGGSLTFNGSSGHVSSGDMSTLDGLTRVSVSAWVKTTATGEKHIIDKSNCNGVTNGGPFELGTSLFTSGKAAFVIYKNGGNPDYSYAESAISVTDGNWHYITGVYNGTAVQVYVDGTLSGQTPLSGVTLSSTSNSLEIGGNCNSYPYIWNGSIDDVRIYNTALTATEIQTDMNTPVGGTTVVTVTPTVTTPTPVATNGSCGSSANQTLSSSPTTNLCTTGTASSVTNSSSYTWSCTGTNGGVTASCSAGKVVVQVTTPTTASVAQNPGSLASIASTLASGSFIKLSTNAALSALSIPASLMYYSESAVWNPITKRVQWIGGPGTCCANPATFQLLSYAVSTDVWSLSASPFDGAGHAYDSNALNPSTGVHYFAKYNDNIIHTWNGSVWGVLPALPFSPSITPSLTWFPDLNGGLGGLVYLGDDGRLAWYNGASWTVLPNTAIVGYNQVSQYDPVHHIVLFSNGTGLYKLSASLSITKLTNPPLSLGISCSLLSNDPATGTFIVTSLGNGAWWQYNVTTDTWSQLTGLVNAPNFGGQCNGSGSNHFQVPIPEYGVIMYFDHNATPGNVYLYKHSAATVTTSPSPVVTTTQASDTSSPSIPTNLSASVVLPSQINLSWSASTDATGVAGYRIYRNGTLITTTTSSSYQNTGLTSGTYSYTVSAYDAAGNTSSQSSSVSATVDQIVVPAPVSTNPVPSGSAVTTFSLTSAVGGIQPFTVGLGFKKGDVMSSASLNIPDQQVTVMRRWNDGSVKHAIASGQVTLTAGTPKIITVVNTATTQATVLTAANIKTANPQASISFGSYGTVNLSSLLATPFRTFISGPEMVEAHYRAQVGSDPSLVAWFHVRLYKNGKMWIRAVGENGYLDIASPTKNYVPSVSVGGATIWNNSGASLTHYGHTRWTQEGWIGGDPQITPKHDTSYLKASKLVPNYLSNTPSGATLNNLYQNYAPNQNGDWTPSMGNAGFQAQIGILPLWDSLYINSGGDSRAYKSVVANSKALNSYPIVWNDSATKLATKPSDRPTWGFDGPGAGGNGEYGAGNLIWERAHHGSGGYLAYLITGDYYHLETMANQSASIYLTVGSIDWTTNPASDNYGTSRYLNGQTRAYAWSLRTISQYVGIAPTGDGLASDYASLLANNMTHLKTLKDGVSPAGTGYIYEYELAAYDSSNPGFVAPWMQHFFIQSLGSGSDIEPLSNMTTYNNVRDYMYKGAVGILGDSAGYCFTEASQYTLRSTTGNDYNPNTWFKTWSQIYNATFANPPACGNTLHGGSAGIPSGASGGYWGNLLPAIAYAVDHSAPGAASSWSRLINASNWSDIANSGFGDEPMWGIVPRTGYANVPSTVTPTPPTTPSNGTCGTSHGTTLSSSPTTNLCTTGTASSVTNSSSYTWSCTGTNGGVTASCSAGKSTVVTPTPLPSTKFSIGNRVQTTSNLNVRSVPSTTEGLLGVQSIGILGTVTGGPTAQGGYTWWNVNFDSGFDGYVAEDFITVYTSPVTPTTPTTTPTSGTCGTSSGAVLSSIPTTNLCSTGTASTVTVSTDLLSWSCTGSNGGTTASCRAIKPVGTTPTPTPVPTPTPAPISSPSSPLPLTQGVPVAIASMTKGQVIYYTFTVATGTTNLTITTTGSTGDADIYLNKDKVRTSKASTWKSTKSASTEKITLLSPKPGKYFLTLRAYSATTNTVLKMEYVGGEATPIAMCSYAAPPVGCTYIQGSSYNSSTGCGMVLTCTVTPVVTTPPPSNGTCGTSHGTTLSSSPTTNLCTTGTASSVINSSSYTWSCTGTNGGVTASCSAGKSVVVIPTQPPVSTAVPSSIASMQAGQWMELPNTKIRSVLPSTPQQGSPLNIIDAWSGGTVDTARSRLLVWGGGHNDYWGNEMYALDLPTLSIKRIVEPSPQTSSSNCIPALSDGTPVSRHTYDGLTYLTHADSFFAVSGSMSPCGFAAGDTWVYSFAQNKWQQKVSAPSAANFGTLAVYDSSTQKVFVKEPGYNFFSYSLESNTYNKLNTSDQYIDYHLSAAIDSKRRKFVMIGDGVQVIDLSTNQMTTMQTTGAPAFVTSKQSPGIAYDPIADRIVAWHGGTNVYALNMDTGVWAEVAINQGPTAAAPYQGTFGRFGYIPQYGVFALINSIDQNAWVFKLSASTSGSVLGVSAVGSNKNNNSIEKISTSKLCTNITSNLHRGNETLNTRKLQEFLFTQGFLTDTPTGFYGDKTVAAVKAYQRSNNLTESGMVYEATRQMIKEESCGN